VPWLQNKKKIEAAGKTSGYSSSFPSFYTSLASQCYQIIGTHQVFSAIIISQSYCHMPISEQDLVVIQQFLSKSLNNQ
jgi:hypothetical protein